MLRCTPTMGRLLGVLVLLVAVWGHKSKGGGCNVYEFKCHSGECVRWASRCNGVQECADGSDEFNCPTIHPPMLCTEGKFQCRNGRCIYVGWLCDGQDDCGDASDEENCPTQSPVLSAPSIIGIIIACCGLFAIIAGVLAFLVCFRRKTMRRRPSRRHRQRDIQEVLASIDRLPVHIPREALLREPPPMYVSRENLAIVNHGFDGNTLSRPPPEYTSNPNLCNISLGSIEPPPSYASRADLLDRTFDFDTTLQSQADSTDAVSVRSGVTLNASFTGMHISNIDISSSRTSSQSNNRERLNRTLDNIILMRDDLDETSLGSSSAAPKALKSHIIHGKSEYSVAIISKEKEYMKRGLKKSSLSVSSPALVHSRDEEDISKLQTYDMEGQISDINDDTKSIHSRQLNSSSTSKSKTMQKAITSHSACGTHSNAESQRSNLLKRSIMSKSQGALNSYSQGSCDDLQRSKCENGAESSNVHISSRSKSVSHLPGLSVSMRRKSAENLDGFDC